MTLAEFKERVLNGALSAIDGWNKPVTIKPNDISNARKALQKLYDPSKHGPSPLAFNDLIEKFIFEIVNPTNPQTSDTDHV